MKPLFVLQHDADDPPGGVGTALHELGVSFEVCRLDKGDELPSWPDEASGIISLGGAMHATQTKEHPFLAEEITLLRHIVHAGGPVWGISLGAQLLTLAAGGDLFKCKHPEVGWIEIEKAAEDPLLHGITSPFIIFSWHEYGCKLPPTAHLVARRGESVEAFRAGGKAWATLFHPEVDADMVPHWVDDAVRTYKEFDEEFAAALRTETARRLPENYPEFCRRVTENWVNAVGLAPAKK